MEHFTTNKKRRVYNRSEHLMAKLYISEDRNKWSEVQAQDLSAGGAKFKSRNIKMVEEQIIYIKIEVISAFSEFDFETEARVIRIDGEHVYAVKFITMKKIDQVMIDEIIHSNDYRR